MITISLALIVKLSLTHIFTHLRIKNLLDISRKTTIQKRPSAISYENGFGCQAELPDMTAIDAFFRQAGVDLAVRACRKAMRESGCTAADITHTVAVIAEQNSPST